MLPDYYRVLGVPSSASIDMIKKAYRAGALKYHPDCGGTHQQMLTLNEAWEILSNPVLRSKYDLARQSNATTAAMTDAATDAQNARRRAGNYPRKWADFEKWMDSILDDFTSAEYGASTGLYSLRWPSAKNSVSGKLFIIIGGIAGFIVGILLLAVIGIRDVGHFGSFWCIGFTALGAWFGRAIHGLIGSALKHN